MIDYPLWKNCEKADKNLILNSVCHNFNQAPFFVYCDFWLCSDPVMVLGCLTISTYCNMVNYCEFVVIFMCKMRQPLIKMKVQNLNSNFCQSAWPPGTKLIFFLCEFFLPNLWTGKEIILILNYTYCVCEILIICQFCQFHCALTDLCSQTFNKLWQSTYPNHHIGWASK